LPTSPRTAPRSFQRLHGPYPATRADISEPWRPPTRDQVSPKRFQWTPALAFHSVSLATVTGSSASILGAWSVVRRRPAPSRWPRLACLAPPTMNRRQDR